ncbi:MAG: hypothetical protein AAF280_09785 [Pseudomonadota bacterium]
MEHWSDVFPLIFFPFKILVLAIGAYLSIKWHYDKDNELRKKSREKDRRYVKLMVDHDPSSENRGD